MSESAYLFRANVRLLPALQSTELYHNRDTPHVYSTIYNGKYRKYMIGRTDDRGR